MIATPEQQWAFIEKHAPELGVNGEMLRKWRVRGVAARYRLPLARRAAEAGIVLEDEVLDRPPNRTVAA